MPATVLRLIQIGDENTWGTATKSTAKVMGITAADFSQTNDVESVANLGNSMPSTQSILNKTSAEGTITQRGSYQDLTYWLHGLFGVVAASAAANSTYAYKYSAPAATAVVVGKPFSIEYGEPTSAAYRASGMMVQSLNIKGDADSGQIEVTAKLSGKTLEANTMTTGLAVRAVDLLRFPDATLFVDPEAGPAGTTAVPATLISYDLTVSPGLHMKWFAGSATPADKGTDRWEGTLTTVLEFNAASKAYVDASFTAAVRRIISLKVTTGATTALRTLQIDFGGTLTGAVKLFDDRDGNMTVSLTWTGIYNAAASMLTWLKFYDKHDLDVMP